MGIQGVNVLEKIKVGLQEDQSVGLRILEKSDYLWSVCEGICFERDVLTTFWPGVSESWTVNTGSSDIKKSSVVFVSQTRLNDFTKVTK